ncbi:Pentatricopeptide repeat [Macleaya cordata]|uniref:Pentatricopeptide repeat n=1 Tax=Macleaya cordata TaxID=56857 RepID=A0A200QIT9_MACCD|nr:Pentatricopeptide repeat [Macleaya cordata]
MLQRGLQPNNFTFPFVIKACTDSSMIRYGIFVHTHVVKYGLESDSYIQSSLIHMYSNGKDLDSARQLFDKCSDEDVVSWNSMIDGYVKSGSMELAKPVFERMVCRDVVSWNTMINGYAMLGNIEEAKKLFDEIPQRNVVSWNSMLAGYVKCGDVEGARRIFREMPRKDVVSWNAMLACYAQSGLSNEALVLFDEMKSFGIKPTEATVVSLLSACAHLGALDQGERLHRYVNDHKISINTVLGTALVDMYAKCGSISMAAQVFYSIEYKDALAWNTIIAGMAMHGHAEEAHQLFKEMPEGGVNPDDITFVAILSAYSHAGMVEEGKRLLACMSRSYGIEPKVEHYGCVIDLLSRAGLFEEAVDLIETMPVEPNSNAWGALLGGCRIHGNIEVGEHVGKRLLNLQPHHSGRYVLLSNIYAAAKRWDDARKVRKLMKTKKVAKVPGVSTIELKGIVHRFVASDKTHPESDRIYEKLSEISARLKSVVGYLPDTKEVLFDIEEEEKEHALTIHSEKLAIAFGFLHLGQEDVIRVVKNLRVCRDCHDVTKLISKVYGREIIVRDRNRFHHFKEGKCSCMDYW